MSDLEDLLIKTSRTFALSIPLLPEPTRREVTVAYLLFRIADTFEDSASWSQQKRIQALSEFCELLDRNQPRTARRKAEQWAAESPIEHVGYQELMGQVPFVLEAYFELGDSARELVRQHTVRTAEGMAGFVGRTDDQGELRLDSLQDLRDYCYIVAGIVGEMLTELFLLDRPALRGFAERLRERSRLFGEALQLVNILKDSSFDLTEGRSYLPPDASRAEVLALARRDLLAATEYVLALQEAQADRGLIAFNALPVLLAVATLEKVEREGPGSKISRSEVYQIVDLMNYALDHDLPVISFEI
ncbi:MAG: squalene/phytoene synthase family protein [Acidobacteriota bacterium]